MRFDTSKQLKKYLLAFVLILVAAIPYLFSSDEVLVSKITTIPFNAWENHSSKLPVWQYLLPVFVKDNIAQAQKKNRAFYLSMIKNMDDVKLNLHRQNEFTVNFNIMVAAGKNVIGSLVYLPAEPAALRLSLVFPQENNYFLRWENLISQSHRQIATAFLNRFDAFFTDPKLLYGFQIRQGTVKDSLVITFRDTVSNQLALLPEIKKRLENMQSYARLNQLKTVAKPMLHVDTLTNRYALYLGLPVDKAPKIKSEKFVFKNLPDAKLVTGECAGGYQTIRNLHTAIRKYIYEKQITQPFTTYWQRYLTGPFDTADTTKWHTVVYYPIQ